MRKRFGGEIIFGFILLAFGTLLLLNNVDIIEARSVWQYWPFILVALGISKLMNPADQKRPGKGAWLIFFGLWLFVSIQHVYGLDFRNTWPMLIIAWGISEVWKALSHQSRDVLVKENTHATE